MAFLWPIIRPLLGYIVGIVALLGAVSGFYFKAKHDGVVLEKARIEREKVQAITKANKERDRIHDLCQNDPFKAKCTPDEWFRD